MSAIAIRAEGVGKRYMIGHRSEEGESYIALRDVISRAGQNLFRSTTRAFGGNRLIAGDAVEEFWALKDVSFEIERGKVVGIIGGNGAGKSTLLKILSRITEPTRGRVEIKGRVASLLEVGTGFHPELTGRENIYLNGAILGMTRADIKRRFDEIVDFAGTQQFLDTPVKRYSSGMYVRLAFAVAAHLEPEILIIDEVLAVGDADFQKKCIGKMQDVAGYGRTVLFVSHNLRAVSDLCSSAMLLRSGGLIVHGSVADAMERYLGEIESKGEIRGNLIDVAAQVEPEIISGRPAVSLMFDIKLRGPLNAPRIGIGVNDALGVRIGTIFSETCGSLPSVAAGATVGIRIRTEQIRLAPGALFMKVALADNGEDIEVHENSCRVIVPDYSPFDSRPHTKPRGPMLIRCEIT